MNRVEIRQAIRQLAKSQGFYCRLLQAIDENPAILDELEAQNFKDSLDMVLYIEG